jgi:uncharacterized damage-inducible protein DinB
MIRRATIFCLMFVLVGMAGVRTSAAECNYAEVLKLHWARTRDMLTAIVTAMPEDKWDYRPVKEVRSFREMVLHLVQDGYSHMGYVAGKSREDTAKLTAKYDKLKTKDELLKALGESYEYGDQVLGTLTDQNAMDMVIGMRSEKMTRVEAALVAFEDQIDHYGNFVVYLRINGVVPPDTANAEKERQQNLQKNKQGDSMPGMSM